jgi:hypothetical protein
MKITQNQMNELREIIREEVQRAKAVPQLSKQEENNLVKELQDRVAELERLAPHTRRRAINASTVSPGSRDS